jgi:hypothetical protein
MVKCERQSIDTRALFVFIGAVPNTAWLAGTIEVATTGGIARAGHDRTHRRARSLTIDVMGRRGRQLVARVHIQGHHLRCSTTLFDEKTRCARRRGTLRSPYPKPGAAVREPFLNAVGEYDDPAEFHRRFRVLAGLLKRPDVVVAMLASAPRRQLTKE